MGMGSQGLRQSSVSLWAEGRRTAPFLGPLIRRVWLPQGGTRGTWLAWEGAAGGWGSRGPPGSSGEVVSGIKGSRQGALAGGVDRCAAVGGPPALAPSSSAPSRLPGVRSVYHADDGPGLRGPEWLERKAGRGPRSGGLGLPGRQRESWEASGRPAGAPCWHRGLVPGLPAAERSAGSWTLSQPRLRLRWGSGAGGASRGCRGSFSTKQWLVVKSSGSSP